MFCRKKQSELARRWWRQQMWSLVAANENLWNIVGIYEGCSGVLATWKNGKALLRCYLAPDVSAACRRSSGCLVVFDHDAPGCEKKEHTKVFTWFYVFFKLCPSILVSFPDKTALPDGAALSVKFAQQPWQHISYLGRCQAAFIKNASGR